MATAPEHYERFALATDDPFLGALIGTLEEPQGSATADRAGQVTLAWWDEHQTGPTCVELLDVMFSQPNWDQLIDDTERPQAHQLEQRDLLQRWLISYWTRLGTITFIPGHDDVIRPGRPLTGALPTPDAP